MLENVEQEDAQGYGSLLNHIEVFAKLHVIVGLVDGGIGIALYIVVHAHFHVAHHLLKIIPVIR